MAGLRMSRASVRFLKKLACLVLAGCVIISGFPIRNSLGQEGTPITGGGTPIGGAGLSEGVPLEGTTPQLLREPENVLTEAQCTDLSQKISFLRDPSYAQNLRAALDSVEKMEKQAEQGQEQADEELRKELKENGLEFLKDQGKEKLFEQAQNYQFKMLIQSMHARGVLPAAQQLVLLKKAEDLGFNVYKIADLPVNLYDDTMTVYLAEVTKATATNQAALQAQKSLYNEVVDSGVAKDAGDLVSTMGGPLTAIGFKLGYFGVTAGAAYGEKYVAGRDLANLQDSVAKMQNQLQKIDLDLDMYQHQYGKWCHPAKLAQAPATQPSTPPPYIPPPPPTQSSTSTSSGTNWTPWIIGGGVGLAVVAGVVVYSAGTFNGANGSCTSHGECAALSSVNACGACNTDADCGGFGCSPIGCGVFKVPPGCPSAAGATSFRQRDRARRNFRMLGFETFLDSETLRGTGSAHRFASGYGAGIGHRASLGHWTAGRGIRRNAYLRSSMPGVGPLDRAGALSGSNAFNASSIAGAGGQDRRGEASGSGGFNPSIASVYVPSWSRRIGNHWTINGTASPSSSGVEPTLTIERQLDSGGRLYGEYSGNYSYKSLGGHTLGGGVECPVTDRQHLNFDVGADLNGTANRFVRLQYSLSLDNLF